MRLLRREEIEAFAAATLGRRLSQRELADLMQKCAAAGLRQGDEPYLLHLVMHLEVLGRLDVATKTASNPSVPAALKRLRWWFTGTAPILIMLGWSIYAIAHAAGYAQRDGAVARDLAWTATEAGAGARILHDLGVIPWVINCSFPGWKQSGAFCVPGNDPVAGRVYGIQNRPLEAAQ